MKIDLHCHSKYSYDTDLEPEALIEQALKIGLDGVCFTEHFSVAASQPVEKLSHPTGFCVFRGVEISTNRGHLLVYGLTDDSWNTWSCDTCLDVSRVLENVHRCGGICVPAHPFRGLESFGEEIFRLQGFDAIETHNGHNNGDMNQKAIAAARLRNLPSIGGSDCHAREEVGRAFTEFTDSVSDLKQLVDAIRKGKCQGATF